MMAHRQFARAMRRKTQWAGFGDQGASAVLPTLQTVASGASVILSQGFVIGGSVGVLDEETTITRTIGRVTVVLNADTALSAGTYAVGLGVFRNQAVTAGVASLASLEDNPDFEWLYYTAG